MSTGAQIATAWNLKVFTHASVTAISSSAYDYDYTQRSQKERGLLRHEQEVNFFTYIITTNDREKALGGYERSFDVEVNYYLEKDTDGSNYKEVNSAFETIRSLVLSELSSDWFTTVDFSRLPERTPDITDLEVAGKDCWRGTQTFTATKFISN
jgi:hypothetical protein